MSADNVIKEISECQKRKLEIERLTEENKELREQVETHEAELECIKIFATQCITSALEEIAKLQHESGEGDDVALLKAVSVSILEFTNISAVLKGGHQPPSY